MTFNFTLRGPLRMPAGAEGGAGGGGGNGAPPAFDAKAFMDEMKGVFNAGINALDKRIKAQGDMIEEIKTKGIPAPAPNGGGNGGGEGGGEGGGGGEQHKDAKTINELNLLIKQQESKLTAATNMVMEEKKARETAEKSALEEKRVNGFMSAIADIPFANAKARQQFIDAYMGKVKWDDDGKLIVETDKGPIGHDVYLQAEAMESPHLLAPTGTGGAGATGGKRPGGSSAHKDVLTMSTAEILAMPKEEQQATLNANLRTAMAG